MKVKRIFVAGRRTGIPIRFLSPLIAVRARGIITARIGGRQARDTPVECGYRNIAKIAPGRRWTGTGAARCKGRSCEGSAKHPKISENLIAA